MTAPREISFTLDRAAIGKGRARTGRTWGGKRNHRTPQATRAYEAEVRAAALEAVRAIRPIPGPVELEIEAIFAPAKSWSKARRAEALGRPHTQKPDFDNLAKAIADGLNGVLWVDDAQVFAGRVRKWWGERACVRVTVREWPAP